MGIVQHSLQAGRLPSAAEIQRLAETNDLSLLTRQARELRDCGHQNLVTYSRKVFIPLTQLCRDVCHYCTFAKTPKKLGAPYMEIEDVLESVSKAKQLGCKEALFTLGERPELRYRAAREALDRMGFASTLEYVAHAANRVLQETGVLPHINAGCMTADEFAMLRSVSASMGMMLESASERLCGKGMPHYGSPDKIPAERIETIRRAGEARIPFTSGILIGIGETRAERIDSLLTLRELHKEYDHIQEIIVQNFRAKPNTKMAHAPEPDLEELIWTIAIARIIFGPEMNIQAPPNLSAGTLPKLIDAGINDWGGVSPVTPDYVNPEAPWPHLDELAEQTASAGKYLQQRLTIYPAYVTQGDRWLAAETSTAVRLLADAEGYARSDDWVAGSGSALPREEQAQIEHVVPENKISAELSGIVNRAKNGEALCEQQVVRLFQARGGEFGYVCQQADQLRQQIGNTVSYVVTRNINYTNMCYFNCQFCAFSKGKKLEHLRGASYDLSLEEIKRRSIEAWERGATELCMQGGIHPNYTGQTYLDILRAVKQVTPGIHVHAFSPLEVWQGAASVGLSVHEFLVELRDAGLGSLPGTAAEVLDDEVRAQICPDKITSSQWLEVVETAHKIGLKTTATIMFGHVDRAEHWARHLLKLRELQQRTGGITEFVPLPFVPTQSPIYLKGNSRSGPTFREAILMHAVARLVFHPLITNIQCSWVKLGDAGAALSLKAGVNDFGGTLMNESITRAAGASHGQERDPYRLRELIEQAERNPRQRTTLYADVESERIKASLSAQTLTPVKNTPAPKSNSKLQRNIL